jgi:DNA repair protein RadC
MKNAKNSRAMMAAQYLQLMEQAQAYITEVRPKMQNPEDVANFARPLLADRETECMLLVCLSAKNHAIHSEIVTSGLADRSQVHAREIFRPAILANACRIILVHNHPSGDAVPSPEDVECTRNLAAAGKVIGIHVTDHVVIGKCTPGFPRGFVSMRETGVL